MKSDFLKESCAQSLPGGGLGFLIRLDDSFRNPVPTAQHKENSLPEKVWEEILLFKLIISLGNLGMNPECQKNHMFFFVFFNLVIF